MLKNDLYKINSLTQSDGVIEAVLEIDQTHSIFKGHFPGQPVLPGACMLQMVKEVLEEAMGLILRLKKAGNIKFLSMVDPSVGNTLELKLTYLADEGDFVVNASLICDSRLCFKFKGIFIKI